MDSRQATCPSCKHAFRVIASRTKCPKCGAELGAGAARGGAAATRGTRALRNASGKRGPAPLVLAGAALLALALGGWLLVFRDAEEPATAVAAEPVSGVDLARLPDQAPLEGTAEDEWAAMTELMTRYITPPFGPASVQAGDRLMIKGKRSIPAILNGFKRLDLATKEGAEIGWKIQTLLLQGLCGDANFGWRRDTRPEDVAFNQQVVQRWFKAWEAAGEDDELWAEIAKRKDVPPDLARPAAAPTEALNEAKSDEVKSDEAKSDEAKDG